MNCIWQYIVGLVLQINQKHSFQFPWPFYLTNNSNYGFLSLPTITINLV